MVNQIVSKGRKMKKLIFISILLIVGCAHTTANFYIGMPIEEFENNNPNIKKTTDIKSETERLYVDEDVGYGFRYLF